MRPNLEIPFNDVSGLTDPDDIDDEAASAPTLHPPSLPCKPRSVPALLCLSPPRTTSYSASSLFDWIQQELVDFSHTYQRGVVWTDAKQIALIGSLFCNYYVPPIVFVVKRKDDGTEIRKCIDGWQRLTSIHRFMSGEIPNKDAVTRCTGYFTNLPGSRSKLIAKPWRNVFKNKQMACVEYEDLTAEQERELFQHVQSFNVSLHLQVSSPL